MEITIIMVVGTQIEITVSNTCTEGEHSTNTVHTSQFVFIRLWFTKGVYIWFRDYPGFNIFIYPLPFVPIEISTEFLFKEFTGLIHIKSSFILTYLKSAGIMGTL